MSTVEEILSNPGSNLFYLNHRYYYAIGNTMSVDLTEGCETPSDAQFLLLGCGDIRNILQTVHEINEIKPAPNSLTFHLNDIDDVLLARNAVLIQIANTIYPDNLDDVKFLWSVWYNLNLSEQHYQRFRTVLSDILENPLDGLEFQSSECTIAIKRVIRYWLKKQIPLDEIKSAREKFICKKIEATAKSKVTFEEAVINLHVNSGFMIDRRGQMQAGHRSDEVKRYYATNTTDATSAGYTNTSLLCPHVDGWRVHPSLLPFNAYNDLLFDETSTLTENCVQQLQAQLRSWKRLRQAGGKVNVVIWYGDALTLCHRTMPLDMKFDFINTSNLCDHITLLDVLLACSKRLKRSGILTIQTMHLLKKKYSSMDKYLETETGIPPAFYPTFLGLRLAEDFELGTNKLPKHRSGFTEVTVRWLSAGECSPCIDIEASQDITMTFERIVTLCFENCMLHPIEWYNTPLTLVYLMKELSSKLTTGVTPLLHIADRSLPKKHAISGLEFRPLALEWKALKLFHFRRELNLQDDDALIAVKVPLMMDWTKLPFESPAGFDVGHRAVITEGLDNMMSIAKGNTVMPWSSLSLVDFDYKTGIMTCILPRSDIVTFGNDTLIWAFQPPGGISPLLPVGMVNTNGPRFDIRTSSNQAQAQKRRQTRDDSEIKLTVRETELSYRITLTPKQHERILEKFEIKNDQGTQNSIVIRCSTRDENGTHNSEIPVKLPCEVTPPKSKIFKMTNTMELEKSQTSFQGPTILSLRRMDVSSHPLFPSNKKEDLFRIVAGMFASADDRKSKSLQTDSHDALYNLKETIQIFLNWSLEPPKEKPLVRGYRILREVGNKRPTKFQFGYFPDDIFIGVRKLHTVNGLPTLDIVWMDFEIYRKQVPYVYGVDSDEAEKFLLENGGSASTSNTWHYFFISLEESVLLKKLLQFNTRRSVQKVKVYGSPSWCFNSFIQPVHKVTAEHDLLEMMNKMRTPGGIAELEKLESIARVIDATQEKPTSKLPACTYCDKESPDLKTCSRCKSVLYCSTICQENDWETKHRKLCRKLKPSDHKDKAKTHDKAIKEQHKRKTVRQEHPDPDTKRFLNDKQDYFLTEDQQPLTPQTTGNRQAPSPVVPTKFASNGSKITTGQHPHAKNQNSKPEKCGYCEKPGENMRKCSRCKAIFYCNKTCQTLDWKQAHCKICRPVT